MTIEKLLKKLNISPKKISLYYNALTHSTFSNEKTNSRFKSYERLEFLGDSLLSFLVSKHLYLKYKMTEGEMTLLRAAYVKKESLAKYSKKLKLNKVIKIGNGAISLIDNVGVQADIFESFLAALYLDLGFKVVEQILRKTIYKDIQKSWKNENKDSKTKLQESLQSSSCEKILYLAKKVNGEYNVTVLFKQIIFGTGTGNTKKAAEQKAAEDALNKMARVKYEIN